MRLFKKINDIQRFVAQQRSEGRSIGFVPTMGALHPGHISLLETCRLQCDISVVSIFVNPAQFNDKKDLEKYPRTIEKDVSMLMEAGCDALFLPYVAEMYPAGYNNQKHYDLGELEQVFEGASRPGHFQGVCLVVEKLFEIVQPDHVFFGQKDYQQCMVIKRLLATTPGFAGIAMHIIPTLREPSGLAMSSRNTRLSTIEKEKSAAIYQTLLFLKCGLQPGKLTGLLDEASNRLIAAGLRPDYVAITNASTLEKLDHWDGSTPVVAVIAAFCGEVRLIDNLELAKKES